MASLATKDSYFQTLAKKICAQEVNESQKRKFQTGTGGDGSKPKNKRKRLKKKEKQMHSPLGKPTVSEDSKASVTKSVPSISRKSDAGSKAAPSSNGSATPSAKESQKGVTGKTARITAFLKNHLHFVCGFILLSCIILQYTWQGRKGGQLYKHYSMICYPERIYYPEPEILKPPRTDVLMMTPWFAPIIWEGTYNLKILNEQFRQRNSSIGLTVFAIKKYIVFLEKFLKTAEKHFMIGHRVNYYIFTDQVEAIPKIKLGKRRKLVPLKVQSYLRWQDISMMRMDMIRNFSEHQFIHEVDYLVCVDVDMTFDYHVGVEILSERFGTLHPSFFTVERDRFTYERRPDSQAYIPKGEGDFYYAGGFFGGTVAEVHKLTAKCHHSIMLDKEKNLESVWHDESHLNKYFLYHKPTKILSPEYLFDNETKTLYIPKIKRFLAVWKNHSAIRNKRSATLE